MSQQTLNQTKLAVLCDYIDMLRKWWANRNLHKLSLLICEHSYLVGQLLTKLPFNYYNMKTYNTFPYKNQSNTTVFK